MCVCSHTQATIEALEQRHRELEQRVRELEAALFHMVRTSFTTTMCSLCCSAFLLRTMRVMPCWSRGTWAGRCVVRVGVWRPQQEKERPTSPVVVSEPAVEVVNPSAVVDLAAAEYRVCLCVACGADRMSWAFDGNSVLVEL